MSLRIFTAGSGPIAGLLVLSIVLLINLAPLALGSNRPLPWSYNALLAGVAMVMVLCWHVREQVNGTAVSFRPVILPLLLFSIAMIWATLQLVPMPVGYLPNPMWQAATEYEPSISGSTISVNPQAGMEASMRLLTYASIFVAVYLLAANPARASAFLWLFTCSVCIYAVYGLARYSLDWNKILWFASPSTRPDGPVSRPE